MKTERSFGCKKCGGVVAISVSQTSSARLQIQIEDGGEVKLGNGAIQLICKNKKGSSTCRNVVHEWSID